MLDFIRSYQRDVASKVKGFFHEIIGYAGDYPLFYIERGEGSRNVLISGGVHGDEPAGTYACIDFLHRVEYSYLKEFKFHVYPCVNPWGFEHHQRHNAEDQDINRAFEANNTKETQAILSSIGDKKFVFSMDMHEGSPNEKWREYSPKDNPDGIWLYEMCHNKEIRLGQRMIDAVKEAGHKVCKFEKIYDDINHGGIVFYPEDNVNEEYAALNSFDGYMWTNHTEQAYTTETICTNQIEERVKAQSIMLNTALDGVLER